MKRAIDMLKGRARKLSAENRARSLDLPTLSVNEAKARTQAWDALAARRDAEIESGQVVAIDGPETLARLRARYA